MNEAMKNLLMAMIPGLVMAAEKVFPAPRAGGKKREWLIDALNEAWELGMAKTPAWVKSLDPLQDEMVAFIDGEIEHALEKFGI